MSTPAFDRRWDWPVERLWTGAPAPTAEHVRVSGAATGPGLAIRVDAPFHGDPAPTGSPGPQPGLWNFEVVELFLANDAGRYLEVEVGPHGHHWVLELDGVRRPVREGLPLALNVERGPTRWTARATLPWSWLPAGALRVNAFAIHGLGESRRYLVMDPTGTTDQPDFHRPWTFRPLEG